jgi:hypothetical protein
MLQSLKNFSWILLLALGQQAASAFSLAGPIANASDAWQSTVIGYGLPGDVVAPKGIGEEYRVNMPVMYYACDANFLDFFYTNGVVAVDQAMDIINYSMTNNSLGTVDGYSRGLTEFPLDSMGVNYTASALELTDLKSMTMSVMMEELGLAEPDRYVWTLHDRYLPSGATCPGYEYLVVQRNIDFASTSLNQIVYSPYVNGTLYTYVIEEFCAANVPDPQALAEPVQVDPLAATYTAVADKGFNIASTGGFYLGLTRDDMKGLWYLLTTNNVNTESAAAGALLTVASTNLASQVLFPANTNGAYGGYGTYNLSTLLLAASTNDPATLVTLFPGLIVSSSSNYIINATGSTVISYFTNQIGAPIGSPPLLIVTTNHYHYPLTIYVDTFANVITNHYSSTSPVLVQTISLVPLVGAPIGSPLVTNITTTYVNLKLPTGGNVPSGDYYLLPTNLCGVDILSTYFSTNITVTNNITFANTNFNGTNLFYTQNLVSSYKSYTFLTHPVNCTATTNATGLYEGIGKIQFVRANFDSELGQYFQPITNTYTMVSITNSQAHVQTFQRVLTEPDFLFTAADLAAGPAGIPTDPVLARTAPNFNQNNIYQAEAGPGTIDPPATITFDKVGPIYLNFAGGDELTEESGIAWGSFDGTTNAPIVYPNGTSIDNLQNQILVQISPATLPNGTKNMSYPATTFTATGGSFMPPFTWTLANGLGGLPPGLTLSNDGVISGTPTHSGTYDFIIQLNDSLTPPRTVQWNYSITIQ